MVENIQYRLIHDKSKNNEDVSIPKQRLFESRSKPRSDPFLISASRTNVTAERDKEKKERDCAFTAAGIAAVSSSPRVRKRSEQGRSHTPTRRQLPENSFWA